MTVTWRLFALFLLGTLGCSHGGSTVDAARPVDEGPAPSQEWTLRFAVSGARPLANLHLRLGADGRGELEITAMGTMGVAAFADRAGRFRGVASPDLVLRLRKAIGRMSEVDPRAQAAGMPPMAMATIFVEEGGRRRQYEIGYDDASQAAVPLLQEVLGQMTVPVAAVQVVLTAEGGQARLELVGLGEQPCELVLLDPVFAGNSARVSVDVLDGDRTLDTVSLSHDDLVKAVDAGLLPRGRTSLAPGARLSLPLPTLPAGGRPVATVNFMLAGPGPAQALAEIRTP